jgi:Domain of unknown function (DUF4291)
MRIPTESYETQRSRWPAAGRHILAHYDHQTIVVYQAYAPAIAEFAVRHQRFGGPSFSFERMSWVKPNFLWMMYRSGWGTKPGQEATLAVRIRREAFDAVLADAVHSSFVPEVYGREQDWRAAVARSSVRLQWDPDHDPHGAPLERRAIQLGLRGETLRRYATEWIVEVEDISSFVNQQRGRRTQGPPIETPREEVLSVSDARVAARLGLSPRPKPDGVP